MKTEKDYLKEIAENTAEINKNLKGIGILILILEAIGLMIYFAI